jgi:HAD superfamily hydrolase (TIGR01549 family)
MKRELQGTFDAIFFDYGGTLFDYASDDMAHLKTVEKIIERFRIDAQPGPMERSFTRRLWHEYREGMGLQAVKGREVSNHCFAMTLQEYGVTGLKEEDFLWYEEMAISSHCQHVRLYPAALSVLERARNLGFFVGLISDFDTEFLRRMLDSHGITGLFHSITCSEEAGCLKPDRGIFDLAFSRSPGIHPERSIYVGDNPRRDMLGAKRYGMATVFLQAGMDPAGYEEQIDLWVDDIGQLPGVMEGLKAGVFRA